MVDYKTEAQSMSVYQLEQSLSWNETLMEHSDENFDHRGYEKSKAKVDAIKAELINRARSSEYAR